MKEIKIYCDHCGKLLDEMTDYKESYLQLNSAEEIMKMANTDMAIATLFNPDRIKIIRESADEAIKEKFGGTYDS